MTTKVITWNCTYKLKIKNKDVDFATICEQAKNIIYSLINVEQFDTDMYIVAKEVTITTEQVEYPRVEFLVVLFCTFMKAPKAPNRLFKQYMENNLISISNELFDGKLVRRSIY